MPPRPSKSSSISRRDRLRNRKNLAVQPPERRSLRPRRSSAPRPASVPSQAQHATVSSTTSQAILPATGDLNRSIEHTIQEEATEPLRPPFLPLLLSSPQSSAEFSVAGLPLSGPANAQDYYYHLASGPELQRSIRLSPPPVLQSESVDFSHLEDSELRSDQRVELQDMRCDRSILFGALPY